MKSNLHVFRLLLLAGGFYFSLVSTAHLIVWKVPGLYIYFNVPSTAYQDRIISLLAFGWAVFFFTGAAYPNNRALVRAILIAGAGAITGLCVINLVTDFDTHAPDINALVFWLESALLAIYWLSLVISYRRSPSE